MIQKYHSCNSPLQLFDELFAMLDSSLIFAAANLSKMALLDALVANCMMLPSLKKLELVPKLS